MSKKQKKLLIRIILSFVLFLAVIITEKLIKSSFDLFPLFYLIPYLIAGYDIIIGFFKKILRGKFFDEEFLMTIATIGALIIGEYPESVFVMVFYQAGELFQSIAVGKSRKSIKSLMELSPDEATVIRNSEEETVFPEEVTKGETVLVRPGEKIPVDGIVSDGESSVDMKALTGESAPYDIAPGDEAKAGSINLTGTIKIIASGEYSESTAAKILELVENSSLNKAKSEKFLTRFSRIYTPTVVICAALLAIIPSVITGDWKTWTYRALIFLVVSCPCALVISVPLSFFGGIGGASSKGILIKGANYLEALAKADTFVFDKTGTLTTGNFSVTGIHPENGYSEEQLLSLVATAEYYSNHPLAKGIKSHIKNITIPDKIKEYPGNGVEAVSGDNMILAGNRKFLEKNEIEIPSYSFADRTSIYVAVNNSMAGVIVLSDMPKENAVTAIEGLRKNGISEIIMLTGDNTQSAGETAEILGTDAFRADLLPQDKADYLKELCTKKDRKNTVAFVGDGINDAPVLTLSDIGIAMGGIGSDAAIEAADIVIMDDNLDKCSLAVKIAKKTAGIVRQNVAFALSIKFGVLILAAFGLTNMWIGVLADVGVAVLAILNAMRTLKS